MNKTLPSFALCVLFAFLLTLPVSAQAPPDYEPGVVVVQFEPGEYLGKVSYPSTLQVQSVEQAFPFLGTLRGKRSQLSSIQELNRVHLVRYDADISPYTAAETIGSLPGVMYAEPEYRHSISAVPIEEVRKQSPRPPNDPLFSNDSENYMQLMEMTKAWDVVKGEDAEVVIAIVDSGTDWEHPDLLANLWTNPGEIADNGIDDDENGFVDDLHGWSFSDDTNNSRPLQGNAHGTAVAGVAVAVADNGIGLAGTSWNAKFMPIDVACGPNTNWMCGTERGVLYAAMNGAHIINSSYGHYGYGPRRTADLSIRAALDLGSLVIASAMNAGVEMGGYNPRAYPAAHPETLGVCGTLYGIPRNVYNYGYAVDVCATGSRVQTTGLNNSYESWYGTSFAAPLVSGIAALVKTRFPEFTPVQIREQIRATADLGLYQVHPPSFEGLLGRGYVNAYRAVTETGKVSIRMVEWEVTDRENAYCLHPSEQINITATFESFLADAENVTIEFIAKSPHVVFPRGNTFSIGSLRSGEKTSIDFSVMATTGLPYRSFIFIEPLIRISDGSVVSGSDAIELYIDYVELALHETATFSYTMAPEGNIGYTDTDVFTESWQCEETKGQMYLKGTAFVHEAGLLVGTDSVTVAGSVLHRCPGDWAICKQSRDFAPSGSMQFVKDENGGGQLSHVTMTNRTNKFPHELEFVQESLSNAQSHFEDLALFRYTIRNQSGSVIDGVHVGLFFRFLDGHDFGMAGYKKEIPYVTLDWDGYFPTPDVAYLGFAVLSERAPIHYKTYGSNERLIRPEDAWEGLTGGIIRPLGLGSEDETALVFGSGPYSIDAYSEVVVDFAMIYGENLNDLVENAQRAVRLKDDLWVDVPVSIEEAEIPQSFELWGNYPNPFTEATRLSFDLPWAARVGVEVLDVTGRRVHVQSPADLSAGWNQSIDLRLALPAGVYLYRLTADTPEGLQVRSGRFVQVR